MKPTSKLRASAGLAVVVLVGLMITTLLLMAAPSRADGEDDARREYEAKQRKMFEGMLSDKRGEIEDKLRVDVLLHLQSNKYHEDYLQDIIAALKEPWTVESIDYLWSLTCWARERGAEHRLFSHYYAFTDLMIYVSVNYRRSRPAVSNRIVEWTNTAFGCILDGNFSSDPYFRKAEASLNNLLGAIRKYGDTTFLTDGFWNYMYKTADWRGFGILELIGDGTTLEKLEAWREGLPEIDYDPYDKEDRKRLSQSEELKKAVTLRSNIYRAIEGTALLAECPCLMEIPSHVRKYIIMLTESTRPSQKRIERIEDNVRSYQRFLSETETLPSLKNLCWTRGIELIEIAEEQPPHMQGRWLAEQVALLNGLEALEYDARFSLLKEMYSKPEAERAAWLRDAYELAKQRISFREKYGPITDKIPQEVRDDILREIVAVPEAARKDWLKRRNDIMGNLWRLWHKVTIYTSRAGVPRVKYEALAVEYLNIPDAGRELWLESKLDEVENEIERLKALLPKDSY